MRYLLPKAIALFAAFLIYCGYNTRKKQNTLQNTMPYTLTMVRGGFHKDAFQIIGNSIFYLPDTTASKSIDRYNKPTIKVLNDTERNAVFEHLEQNGFWELKSNYTTSASCTSSVTVTLEQGARKKTVVCQDFDRDCPDLVKYIDQKMVQLEGNQLKWVFMPG